MGEETFAIIPRFGSSAPVSSIMTSSEKGYSLSFTTQGCPLYLFPLSPHFCRTHGIPFIIQHFPAWGLLLQTLVAWEMLASLEVSQNFEVTTSHHRDVLATNTAVEMARVSRNIFGPSHKKLPNIQHHWHPKLSSNCTSFWTATLDGAHPCHSHRHLCRWFHPIEEQHGMVSAQPAPTGSKHYLIM